MVEPFDKTSRYRQLSGEIAAVVEGETNLIARMATIAAMVPERLPHFLWAGFYLVDAARPDELVIGPYQGALGCLRIAFGRGVCGTAAARGETIIVPDIEAFEGHIACDARTRSEIVVPVFDPAGALIAVFDGDSLEPAAFDDADAEGLEEVMRQVFAAG